MKKNKERKGSWLTEKVSMSEMYASKYPADREDKTIG
jgi:hypothetical protein